jgi:cupin 2 domain-containing protein
MTPTVQNLFHPTDPEGSREVVELLLQGESFRLESIRSYGEPSPEGFWYDQSDPEWVILLLGTAFLAFEHGESVELKAGDYLLIPAGRKHRVESVSQDAAWLALHVTGNELNSDNPNEGVG